MNSSNNCFCDRLSHLEGAAVQAYISDYLQKADFSQESEKSIYICRICGCFWTMIKLEGQSRDSLVREKRDFNV